jgi:poly(A) polymerase
VLIAWTRAPQGAADPAWRGVPRGPALGAAMRAAEEAWIAAGFPDNEAALDRLANDAARRVTVL